jgi:hypothetical protein
MNRTHKSMLRSVPILLAIAIALLALLGAPHQAAAAAYGADDYYLLVNSCAGSGCAAAANWTPYVARLQQQFDAEGWGKDPAVASRNPGRMTSWASWAADHVYYIDGTTPAEIKAQLLSTYYELRPAGHALYVIRVEVGR